MSIIKFITEIVMFDLILLSDWFIEIVNPYMIDTKSIQNGKTRKQKLPSGNSLQMTEIGHMNKH
ncbi:hypothetical protein DERP_000363 [Dermatophagoides pteronyssinus]|uniref:Uncharacterized protein n=1 Tax=Dermatophagoides pteronyssinus TaxID=6956 RepID=A0ABQ8IZY4_DERPT|nr:hypothetical protein DERP_000363 [Dermatophagoides pteronyssinus]